MSRRSRSSAEGERGAATARRPSTAPESSAHYVGTTSQGGPISFDVVGGREVANLMFTADARPRNAGDPGLADAPIAIAGPLPIRADGRFGGTVRTPQTTVEVEGVLNGFEVVHGSLRLDAVLVYRGSPRCYSSGPVSWSATLVSRAY
jgi:hypothetical protein